MTEMKKLTALWTEKYSKYFPQRNSYLKFLLLTTLFFTLSSFDFNKNNKGDSQKNSTNKKSTNLHQKTLSGGDFSLDFTAAAPLTYNHATGGGFYNDRTIGRDKDVVESLEGGDFKCGDIVTFLTAIKVDQSATGTQTINLTYNFLTDATGQSGVGLCKITNVQINTGDGGMVDGGTPSTATLLSQTGGDNSGDCFDKNNDLIGLVQVTGLDPGDIIIVRVDVKISCKPGASPTGNLQAAITSASTSTGDVINVGNQTIPFKNVQNIVYCTFSASCPSTTDLGTFDCKTLGNIPSKPTTIQDLKDLGFTIGAPCGTVQFTVNDNGNPNVCNKTDQTITRTVVVWDDLDNDKIFDANETGITCYLTFKIKADVTPPTVTGKTTITGTQCNVKPDFEAPSATDYCSTTTLKTGYPKDGYVTDGDNCMKSQTRTWVYVDACGNESDPFVQTITWKEDHDKPTVTGKITITGTQCNVKPDFEPPTPSDNCSTPTLKDGYPKDSYVTDGDNCMKSQTRTWIYVDACGNESAPFVQTITWKEDHTAPTVTGKTTITGTQCNVKPYFEAPTPSDNCSTPTLKTGYPKDGYVTNGDNCMKSQTRTWVYVDGCGNESAPFVQTITWKEDHTVPTVTGKTTITGTQCNVKPDFEAPTPSDNCSTPTLKTGYPKDGYVTNGDNCMKSQTRTWVYVDACGNYSAPFVQTITWKEDHDKPIVTGKTTITGTQCNVKPYFEAPTATDNCSTPTLKTGYPKDGYVTNGDNCMKSQTRTWVYVDGCGNESAPFVQTITWKEDHTAPIVTGKTTITGTQCNVKPYFEPPTPSDNCSTPTLKTGYPKDGYVTDGANCMKSQTRTWIYVDACGNYSAPFVQTITWKEDHTAPTVSGKTTITGTNCGTAPDFVTPTATDNCSTPTLKTGYPKDGYITSIDNCTKSQTRTWIYVDACGNYSAPFVQTRTWSTCCVYCTYTQGYWGNKNGLAKLPSLLTTQLVIGRPGHSIIIPANTSTTQSAAKLNSVMPGGSTPKVLKAGDCNIMNSCFNQYLTSQGRINNVLLSQTITLSLNVRISGSGNLSSFPIQSGYITTQGGGCTKLNSNVVNYLTANGTKTATVGDLLNLANDVLGGVKTPGVNGVPSLSDINSAVDAINNAFDGCKTFSGYKSTCTTPALTVTSTESIKGVQQQNATSLSVKAYPNPFDNRIQFTITSSVSGKGSLEVFSFVGQKIHTVYEGPVSAGKSMTVEYNVPASDRVSMIYRFTVGNQSITGKLINMSN